MKYALIALLSLALVLGFKTPTASAAATGLNQSQVCNGGKADVTFTWRGTSPTATQVWLDLTTTDNGWRNGTFISAGPFDTATTSYTWVGLKAGTRHYFRINQQLANGRWEGSVTAPFITSCADPLAGGATPEELHYRNQATATLYALVVRIKQANRSTSVTQVFADFSAQLRNLEPVPPRFADVHYALLDSVDRVNDYLKNPPGGRYVRDDYDDLVDEMADALDDYVLVVGVEVPSLR